MTAHDDLPSPPTTLLRGASLFLDFDGTLVEIADRPDAVVVDAALRALLTSLAHGHQGRVALVSGRSIAQLDSLLGSVAGMLALAGSHGSEYRFDGSEERPERPSGLDMIEMQLRAVASARPGVIVERKSLGVALHYRLRPGFEAEAQAMVGALAGDWGLAIQHGKMMVEARMPGSDKGVAIARLMQRPMMVGTLPVFVGDDITDETGFEAVRALGGAGILVGPARATAAAYRLADPAATRRWLAGEYP